MNCKPGIRWNVAAFLVLLLTCTDAPCSTMRAMSLERLVQNSHLVVLARAIQVETYSTTSGRIYSEFTFQTEERIAGNGPASIVVTVLGGTMNGIRQFAHGAAQPRIGEDALMFLKMSEGPLQHGYSLVGMSQGFFAVRKEESSNVRFVHRSLGHLHLVDPPNVDSLSLGRAGTSVFIPLDEFVEAIRNLSEGP